jgi:hypothetical protein
MGFGTITDKDTTQFFSWDLGLKKHLFEVLMRAVIYFPGLLSRQEEVALEEIDYLKAGFVEENAYYSPHLIYSSADLPSFVEF